MRRLLFAAVAVLGLSAQAPAAVITQWDFNGPTATTVPGGTSAPTPTIGTGAASLVGGASATYASGDATGGSSDPTVGSPPDFGWNTSTYPAAGGADLSRGVQFSTSTAGFQNITVSFDLRWSNSSSRFIGLQYTTDGTNWNTITNSSLVTPGSLNSNPGAGTVAPTVVNGRLSGNSGDTWGNGNVLNLSSISGVNDNPNFGVRMLASYDPNGSNFVSASNATPPAAYAASGTLRYDMVTINGDAITAVPEPATMTLLGVAGAAGVATRLRRKKNA